MSKRVPVYDNEANTLTMTDVSTLGGGSLDGSGDGVLTGTPGQVPRERSNGAGLDLSPLLVIDDEGSKVIVSQDLQVHGVVRDADGNEKFPFPPVYRNFRVIQSVTEGEVSVNGPDDANYVRNPFFAPFAVYSGPYNPSWGTSGGATPIAYFASKTRVGKVVIDDVSGEAIPNIAFQFAVNGAAKWDFGAWKSPIEGQGNVDFLFYNSQLGYPAGVAFNIDGLDNTLSVHGVLAVKGGVRTSSGLTGYTGVHNGMNYENGIATGPV